jgi:dihydrofolate reductase
MNICIISALDPNHVIGSNNQLPWHLPEDLEYFKKTTLNHPIVMGRKTHDSIGRKLPNRRNIIISRTLSGHDILSTPSELFSLNLTGNVFIIGGAEIYKFYLPYASYLYLTHIGAEFKGDSFFPAINWQEWQLIKQQIKPACSTTSFERKYCVYNRLHGKITK